MLGTCLTFQGEHDAWKQRVNKEVGNSQKYQDTSNLTSTAFENTGFTNNTAAELTIHPYHRSNLDTKALKKGSFYMIDSSYLVASDPNSMRNQGPCRNAEYYFQPSTQEGSVKGFSTTGFSYSSSVNPQKARRLFIKNKGNKRVQNIIDHKNRGVYSYGGKTKIGSRFHHKNTHHALVDYEPDFSRTANRWNKSVDASKILIDKEFHNQVNDYHKNISSTIFSPGQTLDFDVKKNKTPSKNQRRLIGSRRSINITKDMKAYVPLRPNAVQLKTNGREKEGIRPRSNKSYRSAHSFSRKLMREKK